MYVLHMTTLTQIYADLIADGSLNPDPAQEAVLPKFERIRAEVSQPVKTGWFRKAPEPQMGIYLIWPNYGL